MATDAVEQFIERWRNSGAAERANCQPFLIELCEVLGVPKPSPAQPDNEANDYVFERSVEFILDDGSTSGFIDLYKHGCFVLEAKQGSDAPVVEKPLSETIANAQRKLKKGTARRGTRAWDDAMLRAKARAEQYARALPASEGRPPFILVVDVGHSIEVFAEFSRTGGQYAPFPAPGSHRISFTNSNARNSVGGWPKSGGRPTSWIPRAGAPRRPARSRPASRASRYRSKRAGMTLTRWRPS